MKISIVSVGKLKECYWQDALGEYVKRIKPHSSVEIVEVMDEPFSEDDSEKRKAEIKTREGQKILSKLRKDTFVICCDLRGREYSSEEFSAFLMKLALDGKSDISFIIGGSLGLSLEVLERADSKICFSEMTFPHQLMRVILAEQIYRAFKIAKNEPYHR